MNLDELRVREFNEMMNGRRSMGRHLDMSKAPVPNTEFFSAPINTRPVVVRGVKDKFFSRLNGNISTLLSSKTGLKRYKRDPDTGKVMQFKDELNYVPVSTPTGSVAITSPINLRLRQYYEEEGKKVAYRIPRGFDYVDYREPTKASRLYIYIVPKEYVYRVNQCALIVTPNNRRLHYGGYKVALQNGTYVYFYSVPLKRTNLQGVRILGTKKGCNFEAEIIETLKMWVGMGVVFHPQLTNLENPVKGEKNIGLIPLAPTLSLDDYKVYDPNMSLRDETVDWEEDN